MFKSKKRVLLFSISTFLSIISIIILFYSPIMTVLHEAGHGYLFYLVTGSKCTYSSYETETNMVFETRCPNVEGLTSFQHSVFRYAGFGFITIIGLLIMLTPISIFGGTMLLINAYRILAIDQLDFIYTPRIIVFLLAIILGVVGLVSIHFQIKWIEYFMKKVRKKFK